MKVETWMRVSAVFEQAVQLGPHERESFLERACGGDADVRAEVERLLGLDGCAGESFDAATVLHGAVWSPGPGTRVGGYTVVRALASGGMGTVFEAVQETPRRTVALKTMRLGLSSPERLQRFRFEVEVLGSLRHPAVAQILEAGTHEEGGAHYPYFAMEFVVGARDVLTYARETRLPPPERLRLFREVCAAVHHGHLRGVIHRDLKADNILVDAEGRPKVIDFGVARSAGLFAGTTQAGELVGTLSTMSPEQLAGDEIDARSDVYALGVLLYELAAGRPPYDLSGLSLEQAVRRVKDAAPPRSEDVPRELHWICLRALEKDPAHRYPSAADLAEDVRRFLAHEPLAAGPPGVWYRLAKLARRQRYAIAAVAAVVLALSIGLTRAERNGRAARAARAEAVREARMARVVSETLEWILSASSPKRVGRAALVDDVLDEAARFVADVAARDPAGGAALQRMIGASYRALQRPAEAEHHLAAARDYALEHLPRDDRLALEILASWAGYVHSSGAEAEAVELASDLLPRAERVLGKADSRTGDLRRTLASALYRLERLAEAEAVARENLRVVREAGGRQELELPTLLQLAAIGLRSGAEHDLAAARAWADEALELCVASYPSDHFRTLEVRQMQALIAAAEGRFAEARVGLDRALREAGESLVQSDCSVLAARMQRGLVSYGAGDLEDALEAFAEARVEADRLFGADSLQAIQARNSVALCSAELGRGTDAVRWAEEALAGAQRTLAPDHRTTLKVRATLASAWMASDDSARAAGIFGALLPEVDRACGPSDPFALSVLVALAEARAARNDLAGLKEAAAELERRDPAHSSVPVIAAQIAELRAGVER